MKSSAKEKLHNGVPAPLTVPSLGVAASDAFEALRNDLRQAQEVANGLERRLSEKCHHHSALMRAVEKMKSDLDALKVNVIALRFERHRLANDAMRGAALEITLKARDEEIGRLAAQAAQLRCALGLQGQSAASEIDASPIEYQAEPEAVKRSGSSYRRR